MKRTILLMNMGGPRSPDEVEVFLSNLVNDKHVINAPSDNTSFVKCIHSLYEGMKA